MNLDKRRVNAYRKVIAAEADTNPETHGVEVPSSVASSSVGESRAKSGGRQRSGRIAKLLMLIGKDESAQVLSYLSEAEVEAVAREIARTGVVDQKGAEEVLTEFGFRMESRAVTGGREAALTILRRAFGDNAAEDILLKALGERRRYFSFLNELESKQVEILLRGESPTVLSVLLGHMDKEAAAGILSVLDADVQKAVVRRMASMRDVDTSVLARIEASLREKVESLSTLESEYVDGPAMLAEIVRHMDHGGSESLLDRLKADDDVLVGEIEKRLFTTDMILLVESRDLADVVREFDDKELALVLKGKDEAVRRKVLECLSERRRPAVSEEYRFLGAVPKQDVAAATEKLLTILREREADGRLVVRRDGELYI